jgi:hypothetical protein
MDEDGMFAVFVLNEYLFYLLQCHNMMITEASVC